VYVQELIMNAILITLWIEVESVNLLSLRKTLKQKVKLQIVKMKAFIMLVKVTEKSLVIHVLLVN